MKTFPALLVKSDGLIYAGEIPEEPEESAVLVSDQEKAKAIIKEKFGHDLDQMTINTAGYEYPIPDLQWEVMDWSKNIGTDDSGAPIIKVWQVAILKESTPSNEQESQEELWNEVLQIAGPYDGREEAYRTAMRKFKSRFIITRRKS